MDAGLWLMLLGGAIWVGLHIAIDMQWFRRRRRYLTHRAVVSEVESLKSQIRQAKQAETIGCNAAKRAMRDLRRKGVL